MNEGEGNAVYKPSERKKSQMQKRKDDMEDLEERLEQDCRKKVKIIDAFVDFKDKFIKDLSAFGPI